MKTDIFPFKLQVVCVLNSCEEERYLIAYREMPANSSGGQLVVELSASPGLEGLSRTGLSSYSSYNRTKMHLFIILILFGWFI